MATEKKTKDSGKTAGTRNVKTQDAISAYNVLRTLKISKLDKTGQFTVIRAARALKPVATSFEDFVKDARERLKPEGFEQVQEKAERFDTLADDEKKAVNKAVMEYERNVEECVKPELEKMSGIDTFKGFSDDVLSKIASENPQLDVQTIMLIEDVCGHE